MGENFIDKTALEKRSLTAGYERNVNVSMVKYGAEIFKRYLKTNAAILELGPAEGSMTDVLAPAHKDYVIVDAVQKYCDDICARHPAVSSRVCLFDEFVTDRKFDAILMGSILDALEKPEALLAKAKTWLKEDGIVLATVANSHSIHRQAAVLMGMLETEKSFGEANYLMGHQRIYDRESFCRLFSKSGFEIMALGGYWLKPVSNGQIEESWSEEMLYAFMKLGELYPEIAAEIYIMARSR